MAVGRAAHAGRKGKGCPIHPGQRAPGRQRPQRTSVSTCVSPVPSMRDSPKSLQAQGGRGGERSAPRPSRCVVAASGSSLGSTALQAHGCPSWDPAHTHPSLQTKPRRSLRAPFSMTLAGCMPGVGGTAFGQGRSWARAHAAGPHTQAARHAGTPAGGPHARRMLRCTPREQPSSPRSIVAVADSP